MCFGGFLDASTHLYMRLCPSVVRGPWVGHAFLKYRGNRDLWTIKHQGTHRNAFLDASTHLYKRLCPSVCPSVRPLVRGSIGQAFLKYRGNEDFKTIKHQGTHRIAFLDASVGPSVGPSVHWSVTHFS